MRSLEDIAATAPGASRWFQLYVGGQLALARRLVERAEASWATRRRRALAMRYDGPRGSLPELSLTEAAGRIGDPMSASAEGGRGSPIPRVVWDIVCKSVGRG